MRVGLSSAAARHSWVRPTEGGRQGVSDGGTGEGSDSAGEGAGPRNPTDDVMDLVSIKVGPTVVELLAVDGKQPEATFSVTGFLSNGATTPVANAEFALDSPLLGTIGASSGKFVATGTAEGETEVRVEVPIPGGKVLEAKAIVRVRRERVAASAGPPDDAGNQPIDWQPAQPDPNSCCNSVPPWRLVARRLCARWQCRGR